MSETFLICKVILVCGLMEGYLYHNVHDGFEPSFLGMILAYDAMRYGSFCREMSSLIVVRRSVLEIVVRRPVLCL